MQPTGELLRRELASTRSEQTEGVDEGEALPQRWVRRRRPRLPPVEWTHLRPGVGSVGIGPDVRRTARHLPEERRRRGRGAEAPHHEPDLDREDVADPVDDQLVQGACGHDPPAGRVEAGQLQTADAPVHVGRREAEGLPDAGERPAPSCQQGQLQGHREVAGLQSDGPRASFHVLES